MVPGLLFFIILIISFHLKFSICEKSNQVVHNMADHEDAVQNVRYFAEDTSESPSLLAVMCEEIDACTQICDVSTNNKEILKRALEDSYRKCNAPMELTLQGTPFGLDETFGKEDLNGNFELRTLKLDYCERFSKIEDNAFDKPSLENLETLVIKQSDGNGIETMNENTFKGLKILKYFEFRNRVASKKLTAEAVLTPLAESLEIVIFEQTSIRDFDGYDPRSWFKDGVYTKLKEIDLRNNYFPGTLNENVFENLRNVEILHLAGCDIQSLNDQTFMPMMDALSYLDLSDNELTTLSSPILKQLSNTFVQLKLVGNNWRCDCDNEELVKLIQQGKLNNIVEPVCGTPAEWANQDIKLVKLCCSESCEDDMTTTTTTTTVEVPEAGPEVILFCKSLTNDNGTFDEIIIKDQLTFFLINSISATNVSITFKKAVSDHYLYYFTPYKVETRQQQAINDTKIIITTLLSEHTYIFCLVAINAALVTPFNCRSHHMAVPFLNDNQQVWLKLKDLPIFIGVTIAVTTICFIIGMLLTCCILRCRHKSVPKCSSLDNAEADMTINTSTSTNTASTIEVQSRGAIKKCSSTERIERPISNSYVQYLDGVEIPPQPEITCVEKQLPSLRLNLDLETIAEQEFE